MDVIDFILEGEKNSACVPSTVCALNKSAEPQKAVKMIEARERDGGRERQRGRERELHLILRSVRHKGAASFSI